MSLHKIAIDKCQGLCILLAFVAFYNATGQKAITNSYEISNIHMTLNGTTNINTFECTLDQQVAEQRIDVKIARTADGFAFNGLIIRVPVDAFDCNNSIMNREFRKLLDFENHTHLEIQLNNFKSTHSIEDNKYSMASDAHVTVGDQTRTEEFAESYFHLDQESRIIGGSHAIHLTDYGIEPPKKFLGTVVVKNELGICFEVILNHVY